MTTSPTTAADADGYFTEVIVHAGVLRGSAETLELLEEFFTEADPAVRTALGRYLIARANEEDTTEPGTEAAIVLYELTELADLLRSLAGDFNQDGAA